MIRFLNIHKLAYISKSLYKNAVEKNKIDLNSFFVISIFSLSIFLWSFQLFNIQFRLLYLVLLIKLSYDFFFKREIINFKLLTWYLCFFLIIFVINFKSIIVSPKLLYSNILIFLTVIVVSYYWRYLKNIDYLIGIFIFCFTLSLITTGELLYPYELMPHNTNTWIDKCGGLTNKYFFADFNSFKILNKNIYEDIDMSYDHNANLYLEKINHFKITYKEIFFKENSHLAILAPSIILYSVYKSQNNNNFFILLILLLFTFLIYTKSTTILFAGTIGSFLIIYIFNSKKFSKKLAATYFILVFVLGYNFFSDIACKKRYTPITAYIIQTAGKAADENMILSKIKKLFKSSKEITYLNEEELEDIRAYSLKPGEHSDIRFIDQSEIFLNDDKQDYVSKYNNNLVKECLIDEYCNYNQLKLLNPDPIKNINLSAGVLLIAAEVTIKGLIKKPWGWGLNNYGQAHAHFNDKNQLNWTKFFANHYIIRDLNKNDGSSTFLKMIVELGFFSIIIFSIIFLYLLSSKIPIEEKLFYLPLIFTQFLRGVGYFNSGFLIILIFITLSYFNRKN